MKYQAYILSGLLMLLLTTCDNNSSNSTSPHMLQNEEYRISSLDTTKCQTDQYVHSEVEVTPIFLPITFIISADGVSIEPNFEITTLIGTIAFEPDITVVDFSKAIEDICEPFTVVIQDNNKPHGQELEIHHLFIDDVEVEMKVDNTLVSTILVTSDGLWVNETQNKPFIHYSDELIWVDATDKNLILTLQSPDDIWPDNYHPWQYYKHAEVHDRDAPTLIFAGLADFTKITIISVPSWFTYHLGESSGKIAKLIQTILFGIIVAGIGLTFLSDPVRISKLIGVIVFIFISFWIIMITMGILPSILRLL